MINSGFWISWFAACIIGNCRGSLKPHSSPSEYLPSYWCRGHSAFHSRCRSPESGKYPGYHWSDRVRTPPLRWPQAGSLRWLSSPVSRLWPQRSSPDTARRVRPNPWFHIFRNVCSSWYYPWSWSGNQIPECNEAGGSRAYRVVSDGCWIGRDDYSTRWKTAERALSIRPLTFPSES